MVRGGRQHIAFFRGKQHVFENAVQNDIEEVVEAWPKLTVAARRRVLAVVRQGVCHV